MGQSSLSFEVNNKEEVIRKKDRKSFKEQENGREYLTRNREMYIKYKRGVKYRLTTGNLKGEER